MKRFAVPILKAIVIGLLEEKKADPLFSITCLKCGCARNLEYYFTKRSGDIEVFNEEDIISPDENVVSIQCQECGNTLSSSNY